VHLPVLRHLLVGVLPMEMFGLVKRTSRSEEVDRVKKGPVLEFLEENNSNAVVSLKL
jgi:hypothetical protein